MDDQEKLAQEPEMQENDLEITELMPETDAVTDDLMAEFQVTDEELVCDLGSMEDDPAETTEEEENKEKQVSWQVNVLLYLRDLVKLLAVIVIAFVLLFRIVVVSGTSMNNTLLDGDYLLLLGDVLYRNPKQGDIIVASKDTFDNGDPIVKRVIATEGQWVNIDFDAGIVYVGDSLDNMVALDEPYTKTLTTRSEGMAFPLQVSEGCLFVLGDNRENSKDSRDPEIGLIDKREILGKVIFLFIPGTNYGRREMDFGRIGVVK